MGKKGGLTSLLSASVVALSLLSNSVASKAEDLSLSNDMTVSLLPHWAEYGLDESERDRGFYEIRYQLSKGEKPKDVCELFSVSKEKCEVEHADSDFVNVDVPVEYFEGLVPYQYAENFDYLSSISGDEFLRLRKEKGFEWIAFMIGDYVGHVYYGDKSYEALYQSIPYCVNPEFLPEIDMYDILSVMGVESGGNNTAVSRTGAIGPMQLTSYVYGNGTWSDNVYREAINPLDLSQACERSADFLHLLSNKYDDMRTVFMAYHDGESRANRGDFSLDAMNYANKIFQKRASLDDKLSVKVASN